MKEEYTPAEADILLLSLPGVGLKAGDSLGASTEQTGPGIGGGGYDPGAWT